MFSLEDSLEKNIAQETTHWEKLKACDIALQEVVQILLEQKQYEYFPPCIDGESGLNNLNNMFKNLSVMQNLSGALKQHIEEKLIIIQKNL